MSFKKYFKCKSIEALQNEANKSHSLERTFGAFQLIMLGIGAIIGAGIFALTGGAAGEHAGPAIILSLALAGLACACAALCYAELASAIPISGSAYTYSYAALGELTAWFIAGMVVVSYGLGAATIATSWSGYFISFLKDYGIIFPAEFTGYFGSVIKSNGGITTGIINLPAMIIVLLLTCVVYRGAEASAIINTIIVTVKMSVLFMFVVLGAGKINPENWTPFIPENTGEFGHFGWSGILAGTSLVFLAYSGFDAVATAAQETKDPRKNLPIGIIGSLIVSMVVYILVSAVLTGLAPYHMLNVPDPMSIAVEAMGMPWFSSFVKMGAVIGLTSGVLVMTYSTVRVLYTVTHDGLLPASFAKTHKKYHTPHRMTIAVGIVISLLAGLLPITKLASLANFGTIMLFVVVCIGTIYLRYTQPKLRRDFECPMMPFIPIAGIILFIGILAGLPAITFVQAFVWMVLWMGIYFAYGRHNSHILHPKKKR